MGFVKCNSERSVQKHFQLVSNDTCQVLSFKTPEYVLLVRVNYTPPLMEVYSILHLLWIKSHFIKDGKSLLFQAEPQGK